MTPLRIFNSSVQAMLFADRLDVMNPGRLPPPPTVENWRSGADRPVSGPLLPYPLFRLTPPKTRE